MTAKFKTAIAAAVIAAGLTAAGPANALYWHGGYWHGGYHRQYGPVLLYREDASPAIALGLFGAIAGAAIASQGYAYAYPPPAYYYAPPVYGYPPACNPGFYWTGETCWFWPY